MKNIYKLIVLAISFQLVQLNDIEWPVPYKRLTTRPSNDPYCQAMYTFCPAGLKSGQVPKFDNNDTIEIYALKAPVWEFKYGKLLKYFNIMHDAIGIRSIKTNQNYTLEWYELNQLLNCTFPHLLNNGDLKWCNQGASCITPGIDDIHWSQNGTLIKIGEMTGVQFKQYSDYITWDNNTGIFYETWTVRGLSDKSLWFEAHDCSTFVLNSFKKMAEIGVKFNKSIILNYTIIELISDTPVYLGNISTIKENPNLYKDFTNFYSNFQPHMKLPKLFENIISIIFDMFWLNKFYLYYNYEYWHLSLRHPFVRLIYNEIPLP